MAGARITLIGAARPTDEPDRARAASSRAIPAAAGYADFPDFAFYALDVESAHFIGGFGRIVDLPRERSSHRRSPAPRRSIEREADIVSHMNEDHADAIELYATRLLGAGAGRVAHDRHRSGRLRSRARRARAAPAVRGAHHQCRAKRAPSSCASSASRAQSGIAGLPPPNP